MFKRLIPVFVLAIPMALAAGCGEKEEPFSTAAPTKESKVQTVQGEEGKGTTQDSITE